LADNLEKIRKYAVDILVCLLLVISVKYLVPLAVNIDVTHVNSFDPIFRPLQSLYLSDFYYSRLMNQDNVDMDTNVILVNIGEPDRKNIARQLRLISKYNPKVVAVDVIFKNMKDSATDVILSNAMSLVPNLVLASEIHVEYKPGSKEYTHSESESAFSRYGTSAHVGLIKRIDNKAASFVPVDYSFDPPVYSLPVKIVQIFDSSKASKVIERKNQSEFINFRRKIDKYKVLDISDMQPESNLEAIRNKIVILGFLGRNLVTNSSGDRIHTPLNPVYIGNSIPDMYGAVVIANIISMILEDNYLNSNVHYPEYIQALFAAIATAVALIILLLLTFRYPAKQQFARFIGINLLILLALLSALVLLSFFNYLLFLHDIITALLLGFIVFEAYAFLFRKRLGII
jgi:CHASE2 domain-containing sensor protein